MQININTNTKEMPPPESVGLECELLLLGISRSLLNKLFFRILIVMYVKNNENIIKYIVNISYLIKVILTIIDYKFRMVLH